MITYHNDLTQGSDEWLEARRGLLTASEMHLILTPTLKIANNDKTRAHVYEIAAQRITGYVEPHYISDDMLRGMNDENIARELYAQNFEPVETVGFITNDEFGCTIGYSPDGVVPVDGLLELKSRRQKFQVETIIEGVPSEHSLQLQTALLVTGRKWIDYVSYCGGMPLMPIRVTPNAVIFDAIVTAAKEFESKVQSVIAAYQEKLASNRNIPTERIIQEEITL